MNRSTFVALTVLVTIAASSAAWWLWSTTGQQTELPPINSPPKRITNVTLGIITDSAEVEQKFEFIANYALAEVNEYAAKQGDLTRFKYISEHAADIYAGGPVSDLHRTKNVTIFLGFDVSEAMCVTLGYALRNGVILLGIPEVHHPSSALPGDEMFRIAPNLRQITCATSSLANELGAKGVLVISRYDGWGSEIFYELAENRGRTEYENGTETVYEGLETVRYPGDAINCTAIIERAAKKITPLIERYGVNNTVVVVVGGEEWLSLLSESRDKGGLLDVPWVVVEMSEDPYTVERGLPDTNKMIDIGVDQTRIISLKREPLIDNEKYESLQAAYLRENPSVMDSLSIMDASFYDSVWVACLSVLKGNSTDGRILRDLIPVVASEYSGASGRIVFDVNGDRSVDYYVYQASIVEDTVGWVKVGSYDAVTLQTTLDIDWP
jgi:hypothetical protein